MRKNVAGQVVSFQMVSATDGSDVTTGTPTVYYTLDGGTQATGTGTIAHEGNGQWSYQPAQAETNGNHVAYTMVLTGAISQTVNVWPVSFDPTDAVRIGISALPNAAAGAAGGLPTDATGKTSFNDIQATAIVSDGNPITTSAGKVSNVGTVDTCTTNTDMRGTDNALLASSAPANFGDLAITATTGQVTVGTNNDKAGYSLSSPQSFDLTGNITGSLSGSVGSVVGNVGGDVAGNVGGNVTGSIGSLGVTAKADVKAEVDSALDTAIPATPTPDSINERIKAIDDLTQAGGSGDLAAILADTSDIQPKIGTPAADVSADIAAVKSDTSAILVDTGTTLPGIIDDLAIKKNTAFNNFEFLMVLASDHVTPATGLTVTGQRSIDGGAFTAVSGTITEVSNGIYKFSATAADTNGDVITWRFLATTADDCFVTFKTVQ